MKAMYSDKFKKYLSDLSSPKPSPGGGSVAGLVLSLGIGLFEMALNISNKQKHKTADRIAKELSKIREKSLLLIDEDCLVFKRYSQERDRSKKQLLLKEALKTSLNIAKLSLRVFDIAKKSQKYIKKGIVTDFAISVHCLSVAVEASLLNAKVNLIYLKGANSNYRKLINNISLKSISITKMLKNLQSQV